MIDSNAVRELFLSSLSPDGVIVGGVTAKFGIDARALEKDRTLIQSWIVDLPKEFLQEGGGGWSMLNLCQTRDGKLWTGEQRTTENLFVLASALGMAKFLLPREVWSIMPGGMPYVVFTLGKLVDQTEIPG